VEGATNRNRPRFPVLCVRGVQPDNQVLQIHLVPCQLQNLTPPHPRIKTSGDDTPCVRRESLHEPVEFLPGQDPVPRIGVILEQLLYPSENLHDIAADQVVVECLVDHRSRGPYLLVYVGIRVALRLPFRLVVFQVRRFQLARDHVAELAVEASEIDDQGRVIGF